jgi:hypothetical protein
LERSPALQRLAARGLELDLPDGNRSSDSRISAFADEQARIVFNKDADFVQSHLSMQTGERIAGKAASANKEHLPQLD